MNEHFCLFPIVQFVKSFSVHFDDICHGQASNFMEDLTEAPYASYCARLRIETTDTKDPIFLYMTKFYTMYKFVDAFFYFWSEYVFHKDSMVTVTVGSNKEKTKYLWIVTLHCPGSRSFCHSGECNDSRIRFWVHFAPLHLPE
jgi:hypothetical protein